MSFHLTRDSERLLNFCLCLKMDPDPGAGLIKPSYDGETAGWEVAQWVKYLL